MAKLLEITTKTVHDEVDEAAKEYLVPFEEALAYVEANLEEMIMSDLNSYVEYLVRQLSESR